MARPGPSGHDACARLTRAPPPGRGDRPAAPHRGGRRARPATGRCDARDLVRRRLRHRRRVVRLPGDRALVAHQSPDAGQPGQGPPVRERERHLRRHSWPFLRLVLPVFALVRRVRHRGDLHLPVGARHPRPDPGHPDDHVPVRRDPPARARIRVAQGRADVEMTERGAQNPNLPVPTSTRVEAASSVAAATPDDALVEAIVVPNALWRPEDPAGYGGGALPDAPRLGLRRYDESGEGRHNDARWGALDIVPTKADYVLDLIRLNSLWPLLSGLACCAIEMMSTATSRHDIDRWGMFPFRASPRQADVLIVAGTLTTKMAEPLVRLWAEMPEPKWCVAMGDCTCSGGRYKRSYSTVQGLERVLPGDVYVPGCPPRSEGLIYGMMKLQQLVKERRGHWPERAIGPTVPDQV